MSESTYKKYSDYREFTCPLCRKRTQLPLGGVKKLPDNFLVSSLSEVVGRQKPSKFPFCDICKMVSKRHREASSKCLDCAKLLCLSCVQLHKETKVTMGHSVFDVEIEKDIECKEHSDEVVRFYCEPCETCICVLCTFNEHKDHEITQFGDAVVKYKENITVLLQACNDKIEQFDSQIETLNSCEEVIKTAEEKIHENAIRFIQEVRNREKELVEELQEMYGKETMDYIENKKDKSAQVDALRSTCSLTEVILKGKDIELLLLKKDVQEKLSHINDVNIQDLPDTINKKVNFVFGSIDLGYIEDPDLPLITKMRMREKGSRNSIDKSISYRDRHSQTDPDITKLPPKGGRTRKQTDHTDEDDEEEDEDDDEEEDSDEDDDDEDESEEEKEMMETGVQTGKEDKVVMKDESTVTDEIHMEDKGVNTRSRSLQSVSSSSRRSEDSDQGGDPSLAARRRRRRERAQTTALASVDRKDESFLERRKRTNGMHNYNSVDADDLFYDAEPHGTGNHI